MSKHYNFKYLTSTAIAIVTAFAVPAVAQATTVNGAVNADNRYMVTVSQGNSNTIVKTAPNTYTWGSYADRFSFNIDDTTNLKQCKVNVIVWGDGSVGEGFAGVLKGNNGIAYTGNGDFTAKDATGYSSGGFGGVPSQSTVDAISPAMSGSVQNLGLTTSHPTWGTISGFYNSTDFGGIPVPSDFSWISPSGAGKTTKNYWVFSTPCGDLVKPEMPDPIDVAGDHFQCYMIEKGDRLKRETLYIKDQFGESKAVLGRPVMLCNPSSKQHNGKKYGVRDEKRHLVCYDYVNKPKRVSESVMINNQMGPDKVVATRNERFCVPSYKYHLDDNGNVIDNGEKGDDRVKPRPRPRNIYQRRN